MVICLEQGADLHMAQLMPLPLTVSCFSKIQIGFTFLVPAHPGSPGKRAVKRVCVCVLLNKVVVFIHSVHMLDKIPSFLSLPSYEVINTKNCSLSIVLTATDQKPQKSLKR